MSVVCHSRVMLGSTTDPTEPGGLKLPMGEADTLPPGVRGLVKSSGLGFGWYCPGVGC